MCDLSKMVIHYLRFHRRRPKFIPGREPRSRQARGVSKGKDNKWRFINDRSKGEVSPSPSAPLSQVLSPTSCYITHLLQPACRTGLEVKRFPLMVSILWGFQLTSPLCTVVLGRIADLQDLLLVEDGRVEMGEAR